MFRRVKKWSEGIRSCEYSGVGCCRTATVVHGPHSAPCLVSVTFFLGRLGCRSSGVGRLCVFIPVTRGRCSPGPKLTEAFLHTERFVEVEASKRESDREEGGKSKEEHVGLAQSHHSRSGGDVNISHAWRIGRGRHRRPARRGRSAMAPSVGINRGWPRSPTHAHCSELLPRLLGDSPICTQWFLWGKAFQLRWCVCAERWGFG